MCDFQNWDVETAGNFFISPLEERRGRRNFTKRAVCGVSLSFLCCDRSSVQKKDFSEEEKNVFWGGICR